MRFACEQNWREWDFSVVDSLKIKTDCVFRGRTDVSKYT